MKNIDPAILTRIYTETGKEIFQSTDPRTRISTVATSLFVALPLFLAVALSTGSVALAGTLLVDYYVG